jgi:site-specific recombinase XerC
VATLPPKQKPRGQTAKAKSLDHLNLSTTQIYAETSIQALGDNYLRALGGNNRTRQHA